MMIQDVPLRVLIIQNDRVGSLVAFPHFSAKGGFQALHSFQTLLDNKAPL